MKKTLAKILALALCAVLLVTGTVFITLAYLQDQTGVVRNTFTAGKVKIKLDEAEVNEYGVPVPGSRLDADEPGAENEYKIVPDTSYVKDPTITVEEGSEPCYVIIAIKDDLFKTWYEGPGKDSSDGKGTSEFEAEYSYEGPNGESLTGTIYDQIGAFGWKKLEPTAEGAADSLSILTNPASIFGDNVSYYYYCVNENAEVRAGEEDPVVLPIFKGFKLREKIDDVIIDSITDASSEGNALAIEIMAFAVQTNITLGKTYPAPQDNIIQAFNAAFATVDSGEG